jgi:bifunctional ADP-heptose synthase (sugar kinase/adenylyltransferase)
MSAPLVVVGDTLLDVDVDGDAERLCPEAPVPVLDERERHARPGGAGLAATLAAADGRPVTLVTALAADEPGRKLGSLLEAAGVDVVDLGLAGTTPTKTRLLAEGRLLLRVDDGDGGALRTTAVPPEALVAVGDAGAVLVADYGRGVAAHAGVRRALADRPAGRPVVWDPHPSGAEPVARVVVVNRKRL